MKQNLFTIAVCLCFAFSLQAQDLTSKKGIPILPQKGDYALGVSATPFLDFVGNATKINSSNVFSSPASFNFLEPSKMYIYGKYFMADDMAIRGKVRIGSSSKTEVQYSTKSNSNWPDVVEDTWESSTSNVFLAGGIEKRRGYGRLQGYYGAEVMLSVMGGQKNIYTYGNDIESSNTNPNRYDFGPNITGSYDYTEIITKSVLGFGLNGFVGVEFFVAPKISLGGEFGWGIGINQTNGVSGGTEGTYEYWDSSTSRVRTKTNPTSGKTSSAGIDTRSSGSQLFVMFHF